MAAEAWLEPLPCRHQPAGTTHQSWRPGCSRGAYDCLFVDEPAGNDLSFPYNSQQHDNTAMKGADQLNSCLSHGHGVQCRKVVTVTGVSLLFNTCS